MLASEALAITNNNNFKADAVQYGIKSIEDKIEKMQREVTEIALFAFFIIHVLIEILYQNMEKIIKMITNCMM